jgi:hypothetical protein
MAGGGDVRVSIDNYYLYNMDFILTGVKLPSKTRPAGPGTTSDQEWRRLACDMLGRPDLAEAAIRAEVAREESPDCGQGGLSATQ